MRISLSVGILFSVAVMVAGCAIPSSSAAPPVASPGPIVTPSVAPYPAEPPFPVPPPAVQPTRRPPITYVLPTPPTPISRVARVTRDQAIATAMSSSSSFAGLQARGQLTITATLTTYGDYSKGTGLRTVHPDLPVWIVRIEMPPWTEWAGPVGRQIQVTWRGIGYVIDGVAGNIIFSFHVPD